MGRHQWRSGGAFALMVMAAAVAVVGLGLANQMLSGRGHEASLAAPLPPIMPTAEAPFASEDPQFPIPKVITEPSDARAAIPLTQKQDHWLITDGPNMPPLVTPCGGYLPSDGARIGAHQLALVSPGGWKLERIVVYRDGESAQRAMSERRAALEECAHHGNGDRTTTVWTWRPLRVGDEAMFVGSQRYHGDEARAGHQRGVLMREGRTVVMYVDFNQSTTPPKPSEGDWYEASARDMASRLAFQPWNQS